jgi:hypothetical protein
MRIVFAVAITVVVAAAPVAAQKATPVSGLLDRASTYVCSFVHEFSTVVAEERYLQESRSTADAGRLIGAGLDAPQHADLRSDLLFVSTDSAAGWLTFRDVYSVNGRPVRDRGERLATLFLEPAPDAVDRARQISREGYRYNLGSPDRTVANPLVALGFLQPDYRDHFEFTVSGIDTALGTDTWILKFKERVRPTILRSKDNRDVATSGRLWIDGASGRVVQTELDTSTGDRVMTTFGYDERLRLDVPVEMRDITWFNRTPITGVATYSKFRRFNIATDEQFR